MGILRSAFTAVGVVALISASTAGAAVRPSDSLVSASAAAKLAPVQSRQGAVLEEANKISPEAWLLILLALGAGGYGAYEAFTTESP